MAALLRGLRNKQQHYHTRQNPLLQFQSAGQHCVTQAQGGMGASQYSQHEAHRPPQHILPVSTHSTRHIGWPSTQKEAQNTMLPSVSALSRLRSSSVAVINGTCRGGGCGVGGAERRVEPDTHRVCDTPTEAGLLAVEAAGGFVQLVRQEWSPCNMMTAT